jgi:ADP-heptose:LPS heptosyltransferase
MAVDDLARLIDGPCEANVETQWSCSMKILLTQIGAMGDCLLTTTIARQIKEVDYPGCHLTWVVGERFRGVLDNNPHVDEVVVVPTGKSQSSFMMARFGVRAFVDEMIADGAQFDKVFVLDLDEKNRSQMWGTCRSIYFRTYHELYGNRVTVSPEPVIVLSEAEVLNVKAFCAKNKIDAIDAYPIIIECSPRSGQSPMTPEFARDLAERLIEKYPNVRCVLSSNKSIKTTSDRIIDGSAISYRENAELLNHCKLLVGANSGITWLNASTWARKIPMVQNVVADFSDDSTSLSYSVEMDYKNMGCSTENLIELRSADVGAVFQCVARIMDSSFKETKAQYAEIRVGVSEYMYRCFAIKSANDAKEKYDGVNRQACASVACDRVVKLFDCLPILSLKRRRNQVRVKLLGIPILKIIERRPQ